MEHIIIIRAFDPDGTLFQKILDVVSEPQYHATIIDTSELSFPGLKIGMGTGTVVRNGESISLNRSELAILYHMACHPGQVFSKEQLHVAVYGELPYYSNAITTAIYRLRSKIEPDPGDPTYIKTVRGLGYKFDPPEDLDVGMDSQN